MNVTKYTQLPYFYTFEPGTVCTDDPTPPITPEKFCETNRRFSRPVAWEFFRQSRTAPDQLRMRMAHVWHQIFVVGVINHTYAVAEYQQRLRDGAFSTFENLLTRYTLSPQLGDFQNWIKNLPEKDGIKPNENFARELMQLFTIGVDELNDDAVPKLDAKGQRIPTYGQADIESLARVLTGFSYPPKPGLSTEFYTVWPSYFGDMLSYDSYHDQGAKSLLGGRLTLPAGGGAMAEVKAAIHALVEHPNTPPFIAKQLIQKTVTSSPTPGYVARVAAAFKNNGNGVRGDLAAVTRAILLDPEARGARKIDAEYGRLREPVLFWTAMIRGLDATTDGEIVMHLLYQSSQFLFAPPTVFNYYPADFTLAGGSVRAPEFGIFGSVEFVNRANQINDLLWSSEKPLATNWRPQPYVASATGTPSPSLAAFLSDAGDADALVERLNRLFLHQTMRVDMRRTIVTAINKVPTAEAQRRVKLAIHLVLSSVDYQVQK